jgi:hypothetical protein
VDSVDISRSIALTAYTMGIDQNLNFLPPKSLGVIYGSIIFLSGFIDVSEMRDADFVARLSKLMEKQLVETNDLFVEFSKKREDPSLN